MNCERCGKEHNDVPKAVTIGINKIDICKECYEFLISPVQSSNRTLRKNQEKSR